MTGWKNPGRRKFITRVTIELNDKTGLWEVEIEKHHPVMMTTNEYTTYTKYKGQSDQRKDQLIEICRKLNFKKEREYLDWDYAEISYEATVFPPHAKRVSDHCNAYWASKVYVEGDSHIL